MDKGKCKQKETGLRMLEVKTIKDKTSLKKNSL